MNCDTISLCNLFYSLVESLKLYFKWEKDVNIPLFWKEKKGSSASILGNCLLQGTAPGLFCVQVIGVCEVLLPSSGSLKVPLEVSVLRGEQEGWSTETLLHPGTPLLQVLSLLLNPGSPTFILQNAPYFSKMIRLTKEIETYFIWWYLVKLKLTGDRLCLERHFREKSNQWRKF